MRKGLSAIELKHVVDELQVLAGSRVVKIYNPELNDFYFQVYGREGGKRLLRVLVPGFIYLTTFRILTEEKPHSFLQSLRKWLDGAFVSEIKQPRLERIVEIVFTSKEERFILILELFAKGNIVLCKEDYTIISCQTNTKFSDREIRSKLIYKFPRQSVDLTQLTIEQLKSMLSKTDKDNLGSFLAVDMGFGGVYASEIVNVSNLDKNKVKIDDTGASRLFESIEELINRKTKSYTVEDEIMPFQIAAHIGKEERQYPSFNEAIDSWLTPETIRKQQEKGLDNTELLRIEKILKMQEENLHETEGEIETNQKIAEWIYENYQDVKGLLNTINLELKKEGAEKLLEKYGRVVKEINLKDKTIRISSEK